MTSAVWCVLAFFCVCAPCYPLRSSPPWDAQTQHAPHTCPSPCSSLAALLPNFQLQVTHKGLDSSSGHYISFVRRDTSTDVWNSFDDDSVETTNSEVVGRFKGGGNDFIAYLLFYKAREASV